ncbi:MAG: nucleotidyltransferase substrate binding protein [Bacteriovoracaceae bacterium]|nr:nucleotidyltransferase substrate binding protein [Bacteriovoracaceae bacterium]
MTTQIDKLKQSILDLEEALKFKKKAQKEKFYFLGIAKSFEVCFEYCWKYFKFVANKEGLEIYSPRDSIKAAGRLNIIDNVEQWLFYLENRNLAVHDYLGIPETEYMQSIEKFYLEIINLQKNKKLEQVT